MGVRMSATRRVIAALALVAAGALAVPQVAGAANPVTVTGLFPLGVAQGQGVHATIVGTGFAPGAVVTVSGTGVSVSDVQVHGEFTLTATITATPTAALGARTVTVTVPGSGSASLASAETVNPDPTLTSETPDQIARSGRQQWIELTGTNFEQGMTVAITGATAATVLAYVSSQTSALVPVTFDRSALLGPQATTIENPDGGAAVLSGMPTVLPIPSASTLGSTALTQDETAVVAIAGTGFLPGATARVRGGGVQASVLSVTKTAIDVQLTVGRDTPVTGHRTLFVHDDGLTVFTTAVHIAYYPVLSHWAVGEGATGWTTTLARPPLGAPPVIRFSGGGVTTTTRLDASNQPVVTFTVARYATTGWRTMTITNGTDTWVVPRGLRVRFPPLITHFPSLLLGTEFKTVIVRGQHFEVCPDKEPTVTVSGTGVSVHFVSTALGFLMYVNVSVTKTAALGKRDVTMTNCDSGGTATSVGVLKVKR